MSYEGQMLENLRMPSKAEVETHLLKALLRHRGVLKEFASGVEIVDELADEFDLDQQQRRTGGQPCPWRQRRRIRPALWAAAVAVKAASHGSGGRKDFAF